MKKKTLKKWKSRLLKSSDCVMYYDKNNVFNTIHVSKNKPLNSSFARRLLSNKSFRYYLCKDAMKLASVTIDDIYSVWWYQSPKSNNSKVRFISILSDRYDSINEFYLINESDRKCYLNDPSFGYDNLFKNITFSNLKYNLL